MYLVLAGSTDITASVDPKSFRFDESLNNRADTLSFTVNGIQVQEISKIDMWVGFTIMVDASMGETTIAADGTFAYSEKFRAGDEIIVDVNGAHPHKYTIQSIDHTAGTFTFTTGLLRAYTYGTKCGVLMFRGEVLKAPKEEIAYTSTFSQKISCVDLSRPYDAENVVETYLNMYSREIIGRMVYEFCPNTSEQVLADFESAWTESGTARAMVDDLADKVAGQKSQATGVTGAGTALWTKTLASPLDLSLMDTIRLWWKTRQDDGAKVTALRYRVGNNSSNFFEWSTTILGAEYEDCWNYDSFRLVDAVETGTVDMATIDWLQIEVLATASMSSGGIKFDVSQATQDGFTIKNVQRGKLFAGVTVSYKKTTVVLEELAKLQQWFWYIDNYRDVHFFPADADPAPFNITSTSQNFSTLTTDADLSQLKNRQTVRGGEAPAQSLYTQAQVCDGIRESWPLDYKPKTLQVFVDTTGTGASYVEKTVGVENLTDETTVDYLFNFNEKVVRRASDSVVPNGGLIKFIYYPYQAIRLTYKDPASIAWVKAWRGGKGVVDGAVITDTSIRTWEAARDRAIAEVEAYKNAIVTCVFTTEIDGLHAGQIIHIEDTDRSIDDDFLIQKVSMSSKYGENWRYTITASSSMFGLVEFFQLLLKRSEPALIDVSEQVDKTEPIDEVISIGVVYTHTILNKVVHAGDKFDKWYDFKLQTGSTTSNGRLGTTGNLSHWYIGFSGGETGQAEFDAASNYPSAHALKLTSAVGGTGKSVQAKTYLRFPMKPSKSYTMEAWLEILAAMTNVVTGGGATLELLEFQDVTGGTVLATHTLFDEETSWQDFNQRAMTFTSHASAGFYQLSLRIDGAIGTVSLGAIHIYENNVDTVSNPGQASFAVAT